MTAKSNILEGLHVLLVSEDDARSAILAKALRERKASVGDVKARSRESLALRGADLVVVDARATDATRARVNEMRGDVRARWASICQLDYSTLILEDNEVNLGALESEVAPLVAVDRQLTEKARSEDSFDVSLRPLGPSRMLRALAAAGPTMHLDIVDQTLTGTIDLSNELLVCAFAQRPEGEKWEAWAALVRILGLLDATVSVSRRSHPTAMNIMEPIEQALEVAAQERHESAAQIALEERAARARVAGDFTTTGAHPAARGDGLPARIEPRQPALLAPAQTAAPDAGEAPKRTLLGMSPAGTPMRRSSSPGTLGVSVTPTVTGAAGAPLGPAAPSRYTYRGEGTEETVRANRTLLGVATGPLPVLNGPPRPVVNLAAPSVAKLGGKAPLPPPRAGATLPPVRLAGTTVPPVAQPGAAAGTGRFEVALPATVSQAGLVESAGQAAVAAEPLWAADDLLSPTFDADAVPSVGARDGDDRLNHVPETQQWAAQSQEPPASPASSNDLLLFLDRKSDNDDQLHDVPAESAEPPTPSQRSVRPAAEPAYIASSSNLIEVAPDLLGAIDEVVENTTFSYPPGAKPLEQRVKTQLLVVPNALTRFVRKPRTRVLLLLLLVVVSEYYVVVWSERRSAELAASASLAPSKTAGKPATKRTPKVVNEGERPAVGAPAQALGEPAKNAAVAAAPPHEARAALEAGETQPEKVSDVEKASDVDDFVRAGTKLLDAGNAAAARDEFARAVAGDGKNPHARAGLAEAMVKLGQPQAALGQIEEAIKIRPRRARYRVVLGDALLALGKSGLAREAFRKALELDPSESLAKKRLGK